MKIDWKTVSSSEGYISIKAAFDAIAAEQNKRSQRYPNTYTHYKKPELKHLFVKVINRAKHIHARTGIPIEVVLEKWETARKARKHPLFSFYCSTTVKEFEKLPINPKNPLGIRGLRKMVWSDYQDKNERMRAFKRRKKLFLNRV